MISSPSLIRLAARTAAALLFSFLVVVILRAQAPQPAAPAGGRGGQGAGRATQQSPASQRPPQTVTPQTYAPELVQRGQTLFSATCGFCHGRDAMGGETGPDLTRSTLVAEDVGGDKIIPVVRIGRIDKGMPPQNLPDADLEAIVAFIHDAKAKADSLEGNRRTVDVADLQTGNAQLGQQYLMAPVDVRNAIPRLAISQGSRAGSRVFSCSSGCCIQADADAVALHRRHRRQP